MTERLSFLYVLLGAHPASESNLQSLPVHNTGSMDSFGNRNLSKSSIIEKPVLVLKYILGRFVTDH